MELTRATVSLGTRILFRLYPSPAPGYCEKNTGALRYVGHRGYSWSSAVSGADGMHLGFYATYLNPSGASSRGYGLQLRCLSE